MTLDTTQAAALTALAGLFTVSNSGIEQVFTEDPGQLYVLPCLVIYDEGMLPSRDHGWREIAWDLRLQVFLPGGEHTEAQQLARSIRARMIDILDQDITLGGTVNRTLFQESFRITQLDYEENEGGNSYFGIDGLYRLYLKDNLGFA